MNLLIDSFWLNAKLNSLYTTPSLPYALYTKTYVPVKTNFKNTINKFNYFKINKKNN